MGFRAIATTGAVLMGLSMATPALAEGDAAAGEKLYNKCRACHVLAEGKRRVGPSLYGLFERKAGDFPGFQHSDDLVAAGDAINPWNEEHFLAYIVAPNEYIGSQIGKDKARTKMVFPGLKNEQEAQDILAYLKPYFLGEKEGK